MATIAGVSLKIERDVANARVTVEYTIAWSGFDRASNQPYHEIVQLIGDDTLAPSGILAVIEDGVDDDVAGGLLSVPGGSVVQSDGRVSLPRSFVRVIPLASLNEDRSALQNPDEIRAKVTLAPVLPSTVSVESDLVSLTLN
jgi:hypothetical protein